MILKMQYYNNLKDGQWSGLIGTVNDDQIDIIPDWIFGMLMSCFTSGMDTNNW